MRAINKWKIEREDAADAALFTALGTVIILSLEFLFTSLLTHYFSPTIFVAEGVAAVAAATVVASVAVKATDDEDRSSLSPFF